MVILNRKSLFLGFSGFFLITFLLMPSVLFWEYGFFLEPPPSVYYELFSAHIGIPDLLISMSFFSLILSGARPKIYVQALLLLFSFFFGLLILAGNDLSFQNYSDDAFYVAKLFFYFMFASLVVHDASSKKMFIGSFCISMIVLSFVSLYAYFVAGYLNEDGRLNALGLGPNAAAEMVFYSFVLFVAFFEKKTASIRWLIYVALVPIVLFVVLSGSRRTLLYLLIFLPMYRYFNFNQTKKFAAALAFVFCSLFFLYFYSEILFLMSKLIPSVGAFDRVMEMVEKIASGESTVDGRQNMYAYVYDVWSNNKFGVGASNWAIQEKLGIYGVGTGSHTHSVVFQVYFKYGFFGLLSLGYVFWRAIMKIDMSSAFSYIMIFTFLSQITGYGFWNLKYSLVIVVFYVMHLFEDREKGGAGKSIVY
jgi:O-antigen ligase